MILTQIIQVEVSPAPG